MTWWLQSRRPGVVASGLAIFLLAVALAGGRMVPTPGLIGEIAHPVALSVFLPLAGVVAVMLSLANTPVELEASSVRHTNTLDATGVLVIAALAALACAATSWTTGSPAPLEGARNLSGYLGIGLLVLTRFGPRTASVVPAAFVLMNASLGLTATTHSPRWWAWPLEPSSNVRASVVAAGLLVAGVSVLAAWRRREPLEQNE